MSEKKAYVVVYSRKGGYEILGIYDSYDDAKDRLRSEVEEIYDEPERLKDSEDYYETASMKDRWWISSGEYHPNENDPRQEVRW